MLTLHELTKPTELVLVIEELVSVDGVSRVVNQDVHPVDPHLSIAIFRLELTQLPDRVLQFPVDVGWAEDVHHPTEVTRAANEHRVRVDEVGTWHRQITGRVLTGIQRTTEPVLFLQHLLLDLGVLHHRERTVVLGHNRCHILGDLTRCVDQPLLDVGALRVVDLEEVRAGVTFGGEETIQSIPPVIQNGQEIRPLLIREGPVDGDGDALLECQGSISEQPHSGMLVPV